MTTRQAGRALRQVGQVRGGNGVVVAAAGAVVQLEVRQIPALRAVLQRIDGVGHAQVDERLRADDAARAAGTIDHDGGVRVARQRVGAQGQLAVGAADAAGNAHLLVLAVGPAVQHDQVVATALALGQLGGADARGVENLFGQFAKGLARHVDPGEGRIAVALPLRDAAGEAIDPRVAQGAQRCRRTRGDVVLATFVIDHHAHVAARRQARDVGLEPAERHGRRIEQMGLAILAVFAHVQQRNLAAVVQPALEGVRVDIGQFQVGMGMHR